MMTIAVLLWLQLRRFAIGARPALIEEFMENISIFTSEEMIFIDEAGFVSTFKNKLLNMIVNFD